MVSVMLGTAVTLSFLLLPAHRVPIGISILPNLEPLSSDERVELVLPCYLWASHFTACQVNFMNALAFDIAKAHAS